MRQNVEERTSLWEVIQESQLFPDYSILADHGTFRSPEFVQHINPWPYPFVQELADLPYADVSAVFQRELESRKKKALATKLLNATQDVEAITLRQFQERITTINDSIRHVNQLSTAVDLDALYEKKKSVPLGILTGVRPIDDVTHGISYGTVTTIFGFTSHGKSTLALNTMYNALVNGFNVMYLTLEMPPNDLYLAMMSMHSYRAAAELGGNPIPYEDALKGVLSPEAESYMKNVVRPSFEALPGKYVLVGEDDVKDYTYQGLLALCNSVPFPVDMFFLDHIHLSKLEVRSSADVGFDMAKVCNNLKRVAVGSSTQPSRMVVILAQANRQGFERADTDENAQGRYDLRAIADINALEQISYYIISIYLNDELRRANEAKFCLLKHRGGRLLPEPVVAPADFKFMSIGNHTEGYTDPIGSGDVESMISSGFNLESFGGS
jgi:hypothetical protein